MLVTLHNTLFCLVEQALLLPPLIIRSLAFIFCVKYSVWTSHKGLVLAHMLKWKILSMCKEMKLFCFKMEDLPAIIVVVFQESIPWLRPATSNTCLYTKSCQCCLMITGVCVGKWCFGMAVWKNLVASCKGGVFDSLSIPLGTLGGK